eukprot:g32916.t1
MQDGHDWELNFQEYQTIWKDRQEGQSRLPEEEFIECICNSFLEQYVMELMTEQAFLDLVLCNETGIINYLIVRHPLRRSDHKDEKEDLIMGNEGIAEALNKYFVLASTVEDTNNMPRIDDKETKVGELVLGLQLFTIYVDDLELGIMCSVSKFVDDTKMNGRAKCAEDSENLQRDIDSL